MLRLYSGSGSHEIDLVREDPTGQWAFMKRNAIRLLRDSNESTAAEILESTPFELWDGTNSFGDEFQLLYLKAPSKKYLKFEAEVDGKQLSVYRTIARTLEKLNVLIRFIAVDVDLTDDDEI